MDIGEPRPTSAAWRDQWFLLAVALTLAAFVAAEVAGASLRPDLDLRPTVVGTLRLLTLLFALLGGAAVLERSTRHQAATALRWAREAHRWRRQSEAAEAEWEERAHEARSALSTIELAVYAAARRRDHGDLSWDTAVEVIRAEVASLHRLLDGGAAGRRPADFSLELPLQPAIEAARLRGQEVRAGIDPATTAHGSPEVVAEIVRNLLDNAHRHAPGAPVTVSTELRGRTAVVRVADRGPGIDAALAGKIFDRGVKGSASGTGLGLYIARRLAATQGGTLTTVPSAGAGAAFELTLPRTTAEVCRAA